MNIQELKIKELSNHISIYDYQLKLNDDDIEELDNEYEDEKLDYEIEKLSDLILN